MTKYKGNLDKHMLNHNSSVNTQTHSDIFTGAHFMTNDGLFSGENDDEVYKCQQCQFQTCSDDALEQHIKTHKELEDHETNHFPPSNDQILWEKNSEEGFMYKCKDCGYKSRLISRVRTHILTHKKCEEVTMYQCQQCQFKTKFKGNMKNHMLVHKNPEEVTMHKCQHCKYQSKFSHSLRKHMLKHKKPDEIPMFKCLHCVYKSKRKSDLSRHLKIHNYAIQVTELKIEPFEQK